jgi:uncharacterized protein YceH (UPF0502 family)
MEALKSGSTIPHHPHDLIAELQADVARLNEEVAALRSMLENIQAGK